MNAALRNDEEIEKDVLGILIKFPNRIHDSGVEIRHFHHEMHRRMFIAFKDRGCSVSVASSVIDDPGVVMDIAERSWSDAPLKQHLDHLLRLAEIREAAISARCLVETIGEADVPDARAMIERTTSELAKATSGSGIKFVDGCDADEVLAGESGERMDTCFPGLYLRRSEVTFLSAEPKTGKTTFATQVARGFVQDFDGLDLMFSMEMTPKEIFEKDIQRLKGSRIWQKFPNGALNPEYVEMSQAVRDWYRIGKPGKFLVDHRGSATIQQIRSRALQAQAETGRRLRLIVIDQFDKLAPERFSQNDSSNSKSISVGLNTLSKELDVAILVLIQINARNRRDPAARFTKNDIFGTSGPEQDAGQIWLMQRVPESTWSKDGILPLEVSIELSRAGVGGTYQLQHNGPRATIEPRKEGF